jgi:hypothetical protein
MPDLLHGRFWQVRLDGSPGAGLDLLIVGHLWRSPLGGSVEEVSEV